MARMNRLRFQSTLLETFDRFLSVKRIRNISYHNGSVSLSFFMGTHKM